MERDPQTSFEAAFTRSLSQTNGCLKNQPLLFLLHIPAACLSLENSLPALFLFLTQEPRCLG